jgi:hypothetical protein
MFLQALPKEGAHRERFSRCIRLAGIVWFSDTVHGAPADAAVIARIIDGDVAYFRAGELRRAFGIPEPSASAHVPEILE